MEIIGFLIMLAVFFLPLLVCCIGKNGGSSGMGLLVTVMCVASFGCFLWLLYEFAGYQVRLHNGIYPNKSEQGLPALIMFGLWFGALVLAGIARAATKRSLIQAELVTMQRAQLALLQEIQKERA